MPTKISIEQAFGTAALPSQDEKKPFRFGDRTSKPTVTTEVDDDGLDILGTLSGIATAHGTQITSGKRPVINYGAGAGSAHTQGKAADFRTHDLTREQGDALVQDLRDQGFWVNDERDNWREINPKTGKQRGTGPHIHAEWRGGSAMGGVTEDSNIDEVSVNTPPKKKKLSLAEAFGADSIADTTTNTPTKDTIVAKNQTKKPPGLFTNPIGWIKDQYTPSKDNPLGSVIPKFIREPTEEKVAQVAKYLTTRYKTNAGLIKPDDPDYNPAEWAFTGGPFGKATLADYERVDPYREQRLAKKRSDELVEAGVAEAFDAPPPKGFIEQLQSRSVIDLILNDSLPANAIEWAAKGTDTRYQNLLKARDTLREENIAAHPEQFPAVTVEAARKAIAERKAKQGHGIADTWKDLKTAAKEDPGRFGATLLQALAADPEMLFVPVGLGIKPVQAVKTARGIATAPTRVAERAARIADNLIDVGTTGGGLNLAIEAAQKGSEGQDFGAKDAATSFGIGAAMAAPFGLIGKGKAAVTNIASGNVTKETLKAAISDVAKADVLAEEIIGSTVATEPSVGPNPFIKNGEIDRTVKHRIEESLGVKFESDADLVAYLKAQRAEWKKLFAERDLNGQLQKATAEERISRRRTLLEEQQGREAQAAAEGEKAAQVEQAYAEDRAAKLSRLNDNYEQALAQRDAAIAEQSDAMWQREADLREADAAITQQEILDAAMTSDVPAIRNAMLRAAHRDEKLRVPKWQRGEIDPKTLTRLGIGSLFAGTAYAAADDDQKLGAAFAAGLAGLVIPGGGSVLRKMRQSGAVSLDGALLDTSKYIIRNGDILDGANVRQQWDRDLAAIDRAKTGDQAAFAQIYKDHAKRLERYIDKKIFSIKGKLGIDAEDIAVGTLADVFSKIDDYKPDAPFSAYLIGIARKKIAETIRNGTTLEKGRKFSIDSADAPDVRDPFGETYASDAFDRGAGADMEVTAESVAQAAQTQEVILRELKKLPDRERKAFLLNKADQYSVGEVAELMGMSYENTKKIIQRVQDSILTAVEKGFGAKKSYHGNVKPVEVSSELVKRGRGRPRKDQAGEVDPELLKIGAKVAIAGLAGVTAANMFTDTTDAEGNPRPKDQWAPLISGLGTAGLAAFMLLSKGRGGSVARNAATFVDELFGSSSTRILNKSKSVFGAIQSTIRATASETHKYIESTAPFLRRMNKLPQETQDIIARALYTGKAPVINKIFEAIGDRELIESYKAVRSTLDSLGDKLVGLKRFSKGAFEYFPRIIKDKDGLFNAIGKTKADDIKKILNQANVESMQKSGKPLTGYEENALINSILFGGDHKSIQPGWAKARGIEEITEELLPFYATPAESLHSYIRSAVADVEKAKFFGKNTRNMKQGKHEFLDVDASVGLMMEDELMSGKLSEADADEIAGIIKDFFGKGQMGEPDFIRRLKDISYIGLLGNFLSTTTQLADIPVSVYTQDLRSTIGAVIRQATGKKLISAKELGLVDNISQEFAGQERSTRALNSILKKTLFSHVDQMGKNTALNAALLRAQRLVKTEGGVTKISAKYQEIFGNKFNSLISDLKAGRISDEVKDYAWMELSRTQPISMLEMPQAYIAHPKIRGYLMLKSFVIKQIDLARRDAIQNIASKDPKRIAKGIKNLTEMTIVMGTAGAGTQMVKDWLQNKDVKFELSDVPLNMIKNLGWSEYQIDKFKGVSREEAARRRLAGEKNARAQEAKPGQTIGEFVIPPYRIFDEVIRGDSNAIRYVVPGIGPWLAQKLKETTEMEQEVQNE